MNIVRTATRIQDQDDFSGTPTSGQVVAWDGTKFAPTTIPAPRIQDAVDYTGTPTANQVLAWNGSKFAPATVTATVGLGSSLTGSPTTGAILIVGSSGVLAQDATRFTYDATNRRFGVGTANPTSAGHFVAAVASDPALQAVGVAGQTADLFRVQTPTTTAVSVTAAGFLNAGSGFSNAQVISGNPTLGVASQFVAIGSGVKVDTAANTSITIGYNTWSRFANQISIGCLQNGGTSAISVGVGSSCFGNYQIVLGYKANGKSTYPNSMIVGPGPSDDAAATIRAIYLGGASDAMPQPFASYSVTDGAGIDIGASDVVLAAGRSTGLGTAINARGGGIRFQRAIRNLTSGASWGTLVDAEWIVPEKAATNGVACELFSMQLAIGTMIGYSVEWSVEVFDGADMQRIDGGVTSVSAVNRTGTPIIQIAHSSPAAAVTAGTLAVTADTNYAAQSLKFRLTPTSSLTVGTGRIVVYYKIKNNSRYAVSIL